MYDKLFRVLIGALGGLTKSSNNNLGRDPAFGQLITAKKILELAKGTGNKELIKKAQGMVGGLSKSAKYGLGRDPAEGQMKTIRDMLNIVSKYK